MSSVFDVATYILKKKGPMSSMKLQKLCYYAKAWFLVWEDQELFFEKIEAWANGPVIPKLFEIHKGKFTVSLVDFSERSQKLDKNQKASIDKVLEFYGDKSSQWLSDLTHMEEPWRNARHGVPDGEKCNNEITSESMHEYYSSI